MNEAIDTCGELWAWIESFITQDRRERAELRAAQFRELCAELGQPQQKFRSIHVAGSKGKGQTASYIAHGLAGLGWRTGLFTSPHIHSYSERIQVFQPSAAPEFLPAKMEAVVLSEILRQQGALLRRDFRHCYWGENSAAKLPPNFFAVLTLLAFRSFAAAACDWVVLETGIGGRLCPTNVVLPELSVITPIELEHTDLLGDRLELIAAEKAAIIKAGRPCVVAAQYPEVAAVLRSHSVALHWLPECRKDFQIEELATASTSLWHRFLRPRKLRFEMVLDHQLRCSELSLRAPSRTQADNIALALLAFQVLAQNGRPEISLRWNAMLQGMQCSRLPGRFTVLRQGACVLLFDGAHTPVSCKRLLQDLQSYLRGGEKLSLLFAAVQGKNFTEMARILAPHFAEIGLTRAGTFKKNNLAALEQAFRQTGNAGRLACIEKPQEALQALLQNGPDLLLVCGSFYLLGELLPPNSRII